MSERASVCVSHSECDYAAVSGWVSECVASPLLPLVKLLVKRLTLGMANHQLQALPTSLTSNTPWFTRPLNRTSLLQPLTSTYSTVTLFDEHTMYVPAHSRSEGKGSL